MHPEEQSYMKNFVGDSVTFDERQIDVFNEGSVTNVVTFQVPL